MSSSIPPSSPLQFYGLQADAPFDALITRISDISLAPPSVSDTQMEAMVDSVLQSSNNEEEDSWSDSD